MPVWVILLVAGVLIVAAFVLVIAIHILDVHAEQQCAHLHDLSQRSLQQNQIPSPYQYRGGESQLCCVCGSVRFRRSQTSSGNNSLSRSKSSSRTGSAGGLLQPLVDAACGKTSLGSGSIECLSGLSSRRHGMASGLQGGWFNARNLFKKSSGSRESQKKSDAETTQDSVSLAAAASSASSGSSSSAAAFASASRTVGGSGSSSMTTITATITTTSAPSSISPSTNAGTQASGSHGTDEATYKPASQRRLVLEILMSPSGTLDGQGGSIPRATGVRLKLETNASLESLASLAAAASSGVASSHQPPEADSEAGLSTAGISTAAASACCPVPAVDLNVSKEGSFPGGYGSSCRASGTVVKLGNVQAGLAASVKADGLKNESHCQGSNTAVCISATAAKISVQGDEVYSEIFSGSSADSSICVSSLDKNGADCGLFSSSVLGTTSSGTASLASAAACKSKQSMQAVAIAANSKAKSKSGTCSSGTDVCPLAALVSGGGPSSSNANIAKGTYHQASFNSSLDGLGSLRISVLDGGAKGKSMRECSKGVTAEIASALAALNVESIGGKGVGMSSTLGVGNVPADGPTKGDKVDVQQEDEVPGDGSGSEQIVEEGDEHQPAIHAKGDGPEEDEVDGAKKEKRKKKNRVRRQKAKAAAVAAAAASVEAQDRHSHEKQSTECGEKTGTALEVEVGCICGTPKGSCHSIGCPYPFTSSGSMVQRKIKEQYDELVRSNVAKSLTLAQVGRFTTCLVEAKSSLQQKSDTIQRRFTIAKSLLSKADKSSFDRLCGQIYGLEIEQKKLEEDTVVYNRLQEQLKLSPAYQKMLEYGRTHFELQPNTGQLIEKVDSEDMEISFEELLAQEKKDSFWQKHGPSRSSVQVS
ncbi:hypothetical protein MPTK1_1g20470 [Marchantia polymorpha subsp. ruderalis]|uniref:Uncharacterized protein n=2 Tax=Marchantia polymorpha TaxID=3197 RepID=A0AAF6ASA7_MARPO|nr:hypothetical protein MARPO_0001s0383 [Marchantia polymorpha]BBM99327.1 hypothetical protein Mp_1g20470 [Marchantia polymorpha subsp. ruderalis]|eukprot:PTQ50409.1 hypothetical protein MARPO_0001s0383 [Marchantia polymorpha]